MDLKPTMSQALIICEHGNRRLTRLEKNGCLTVLEEKFEGRRVNSPKDVVEILAAACERESKPVFDLQPAPSCCDALGSKGFAFVVVPGNHT